MMPQKYSTNFFTKMNELIAQPGQKTKFYLSFVTLLVGVVAGSHTAIAQTGAATQKQHRSFDRILVSHQHLSNQGSKHLNIPKGFIAGGERPDDLDERNDKRNGKHRDGKTTGGGQHHQGVLPMPKPKIDDGSGDRIQHIIMPNPRIDTGERKNPSITAPKH